MELKIPAGQTMIIYGEVIGDITISGGGVLILYSNAHHDLEFEDVKLIPQGRDFEENKE